MDIMEESGHLAHPSAGYRSRWPCSWVIRQGSPQATWLEAVVPALCWHAPNQSTVQFIATLPGGRYGDEGPISPLWGMVHSAELF